MIIFRNHKRNLLSKFMQVRRELARLRLSLRFMKENWEAGTVQLNFMIKFREQLPAGHPSHQLLEEGIHKLNAALLPYAPDRQDPLQNYVDCLEQQERWLREMTM